MKKLLVWLSTPVGVVTLKLALLIAALGVKTRVSPLGDPKNGDFF